MKRILLLIAFSLSSLFCIGQTVYTVSSYSGSVHIHKIDFENSTLIHVFDYNSPWGVADIAISPDGTFYGVGQDKIYRINSLDGTIEVLSLMPNISVTLTCGNDNKLYTLYGSGDFLTYDLETDVLEVYATPELHSPGDITFYSGNIILHNDETKHITAYNMESGSIKTILCSNEAFLDGCLGLWGIATVYDSCDNETVYASDNENSIYQLDIETGVMINLEIDTSLINGYQILGLASNNEYLSFDCESIELTEAQGCPVVPECDPFASTQESQISETPIIYPNPTQDWLFVDENRSLIAFEIYSLQGKLIRKDKLIDSKISIQGIESGYYTLKLISNTNTSFTTFIINEKE